MAIELTEPLADRFLSSLVVESTDPLTRPGGTSLPMAVRAQRVERLVVDQSVLGAEGADVLRPKTSN